VCWCGSTRQEGSPRQGDCNSAVLTGISVYINIAAVICALVALPLFIGATRRRFLDKNNLLGLTLVGIAILLHGGFQTLLRSSPHAEFSGYVLGWSGGSEDSESSLWIYDLGFPPGDRASFPDAPYRNLRLTRSRTNRVPASFWNSNSSEYVKCDYRVWDLEITRIDAVPVPNAKQAVSAGWQWDSDSEKRIWPFLEAFLGFLVACACVFLFGETERIPQPSSANAVRRFPNKWAGRIYITAVLVIVAWVALVRFSDMLFQHKGEVLLRDIQQLELRKSNWQDAERIRTKYGKHVSTSTVCSATRCDFTVTLDHWYIFLRSGKENSEFGRIAWTAWSLPEGRWAFIEATVRVRDGVVWAKDFTATISHRENYPLVAMAQTTRDFEMRSWYRRDPHPDIRFGRPGGCEICQALWAKVTPYATTADMQDAFAFDLSCIGATLRRCTDMSQIMPVAARRLKEDLKPDGSGAQPPFAWSPALLRACGRDAESAAVAEVLRADLEKSNDMGYEIEHVDYRILEALKGTFTAPLQHASFNRRATTGVPDLHQHVIVFGFEGDDTPMFVPVTDDNLQEVRVGIAEDAVDIPRRR
jgi:hypothetical protein